MGDLILRLLAVVVVCLWSVVSSEVNGSDFKDSIVVTSLMKNIFSTYQHVNMIPGTLYDINTRDSMFVLGLNNFYTRLLSVEVDYARSRLFIYDANTAAIYAIEKLDWRENFENRSLKLVHYGGSRYSARLSMDWVSNNIYWTDPLFGWIAVQSGRKNDTYKILVDELEKPYALAVDPVHKQMFWSDVGSTVKIERASLSGADRKTIISTGLAFPTSIDIDQSGNKLVWVDALRDTLETADFNGNHRRVIRRMSHTLFYDVAVYRDLVAVTDLSNGSLIIVNKKTGEQINYFTKSNGDPFMAVALYFADIQPVQDDRCSDSDCPGICINSKNDSVCLCKEGYKLIQAGSNKTCSEDLGKFHRAFMFSNNSDICMKDIRSLTSNGHEDIIDCFFKNGTSITQFDIDMSERLAVVVDNKAIYSINTGNSPQRQALISANQTITGVAIDWRDNNVYWCMGESEGQISFVSQKTLASYPLINRNLAYPKNLNILPFHNILVWISGTSTSSKIEKSKLDGSDREVLVSGRRMKGLTVDYSTYTLYFVDEGYVKSCDTEGKQLTVLTPDVAILSPMMLLAYKNYLIVADNAYPTDVIKVYEKKSAPVLRFQLTAVNVTGMTDMHVLDALLHPDVKGPCAILNGDCEQICIPVGRNRICQCEYGFHLDSDKKSCSSTPLTDNFLLVTDWTHNKIYQVSLVNDSVRAIDSNTYGSPIGIAFNHLTKTVIWSSNELVHSISLNGTQYTEILATEMIGCHADRFAIDYPGGNIYYTANPTLPWGFVGVGIISPGGLHKRLISYGVRPRDIGLDSEDGLLFWTDHGASPPFVRKANMDGSHIVSILDSGLVWPNGLAIDTEANRLYVTDGGTDVIYSCSYQGGCVKYYTDKGAHLMDIELSTDYLYYTAWNRPYVTKLHKTYPGSTTRLGTPELGRLDSLFSYNSSVQSSKSAECSENNGLGPCSTFCLPTPTGYTCSCEDGVSLRSDGMTCQNVELPSTTATPSTTPSSPTTPSSTTTTLKSSSEESLTSQSSETTLKSSSEETLTSPSTTEITTSLGGTTTKSPGLPVAVIVGGVAGFVILVLVIIILVIIFLKRSNNTKNNGTNNTGDQPANQTETGFDIAFVTSSSTEPQRPDSTYDLINFDDIDNQTKTDKEGLDNTKSDYMTLLRKQNNYEQLSFKKDAEPSQQFRPSAAPNEYQLTDAVTSAESRTQTAEDYLEPIHTVQNSVDEDFNNPVYMEDPSQNNTNPFLGSINPVSSISYY